MMDSSMAVCECGSTTWYSGMCAKCGKTRKELELELEIIHYLKVVESLQTEVTQVKSALKSCQKALKVSRREWAEAEKKLDQT